jgi:formylglycine-generating enzyme required for sulfatase activity
MSFALFFKRYKREIFVAYVITIKGIDQAISNLNYRNKNSLKYRLVNTIRQFYKNESSIESIDSIGTEQLITLLWDTVNDPAIIKKKRKNLSSLKSSVNTNLKQLYKEKKNPEGIIIGSANVFVMSNEAKDDALKAFKISTKSEETVSLGQIKDILNIVNEILSDPEAIADKESAEGLRKFDQVKNLIWGLSEKVGLGASETIDQASRSSIALSGQKDTAGDSDLAEVTELIEEPEEIEVDDTIEEVEVSDELDEVEVEEDLDEVEVEEDLENCDVIEESGKETDLLDGDLGEKFSDGGYQYDNETRKAKLLAEEFNNLLGVIDKYYNQYIPIPKGEYIVGSKRPKTNEKPEQLVYLSPFYIGKFPVTNALFEIFTEKTGYKTTAEKIGFGTVYYGCAQRTVDEKTGLERFTWNTALISKTVEDACWYQPLGRGSTIHNKRNHPVVQVSIEDAIAFAAWTGKNLPTEDEWEAASRTAKGYMFPWGNEWNKDSCNVEESYIGNTTPVDKYLEFGNDYGIVDVIGNVLEWTREKSEPPSFEKDRSKYYIAKGGSWISGNGLRLFSRFTLKPESHSNILGFRCIAY